MTYRQLLWECALDQHGLVSTRDAADLGIPSVELRKLASRGFLTNVAYGVYLVPDAPTTPRREFAEAVLRVGRDAYLTHDAVLALHDLALVNPRRIRVGTPHRVRADTGPAIEVIHQTLPPEDLTTYDGIPSTTVSRALLDCRGTVMTDRLREAAAEAEKNGLLLPRERDRVHQALGSRDLVATP